MDKQNSRGCNNSRLHPFVILQHGIEVKKAIQNEIFELIAVLKKREHDLCLEVDQQCLELLYEAEESGLCRAPDLNNPNHVVDNGIQYIKKPDLLTSKLKFTGDIKFCWRLLKNYGDLQKIDCQKNAVDKPKSNDEVPKVDCQKNAMDKPKSNDEVPKVDCQKNAMDKPKTNDEVPKFGQSELLVNELSNKTHIFLPGEGTAPYTVDGKDVTVTFVPDVMCRKVELCVKGLSNKTTKESLHAHFSLYGELHYSSVHQDPPIGMDSLGKYHGLGFVRYKEPKSLEKAMSAAPHTVDGKEVAVSVVKDLMSPNVMNFLGNRHTSENALNDANAKKLIKEQDHSQMMKDVINDAPEAELAACTNQEARPHCSSFASQICTNKMEKKNEWLADVSQEIPTSDDTQTFSFDKLSDISVTPALSNSCPGSPAEVVDSDNPQNIIKACFGAYLKQNDLKLWLNPNHSSDKDSTLCGEWVAKDTSQNLSEENDVSVVDSPCSFVLTEDMLDSFCLIKPSNRIEK